MEMAFFLGSLVIKAQIVKYLNNRLDGTYLPNVCLMESVNINGLQNDGADSLNTGATIDNFLFDIGKGTGYILFAHRLTGINSCCKPS